MIIEFMQYVAKLPPEKKAIYVSATDIPVFLLCKYPILSAFKIFAWNKFYGSMNGSRHFCADEIIAPETESILSDISDLYNKIDSNEIWSNETIDPYLNLVRYFYEIGCFSSVNDAILICDQLKALMIDTMNNGERGQKESSKFNLFLTEVDLDNYFVYARMEKEQICYVRLYSLSVMSTSHISFCKEIKQWFDSMINKLVLISGFSKKQFVVFF
jgi:hypothetical protein